MSSLKNKLGIYFSHYECFGHTARAMAVADVFKKRFPKGDLFFIQGGVGQPKSKIDQMGRLYALPGVLMDRRHFRGVSPRSEADAQKRSQVCLDIISKERPDILITEFFPLGMEDCRYELIPSLIKAVEQNTSLWAVAGYPMLTGINDEWREKIIKLYQKIIIFSPPSEKDRMAKTLTQKDDRQRYLDFFKRHASKIEFAGYLLPWHEVVKDDEDENLPKPPVPKGACRIVVLRGGGAVYPKIIAEAIVASDLLGREFYVTVVAGPSTSGEEWYFFSNLVGKKKIKNLVLLRSVGDYEGLIKSSDVCVSGSGYHTSLMLLKHQKRSIIIPFEGYGSTAFQEQPARAALLKKMIGARILSMGNLTASKMAQMIKTTAASPLKALPIPKDWFGAEPFLDQKFQELFSQ